MRRAMLAALVVAAASAVFMVPSVGAEAGTETTYVVVYDAGASPAAARAAVAAAGGRIVREQKAIGVASVVSSNRRFAAEVSAAKAVYGAARNRPIGYAPPTARPKRFQLESERGGALGTSRAARARSSQAPEVAGDPLTGLQWDMQMIHATPDGSYAEQKGTPEVAVGVMDTGIDGSHPDIAPNFDYSLSRNFTEDIPAIDGACENPGPDPCKDPNNVDED